MTTSYLLLLLFPFCCLLIRLQRVHVKGPDHPTPFAKGTSDNDNTSGGTFFGTTSTPQLASTVEAEEVREGPTGWKAAKISADLHLADAINTYESSRTANKTNFYDQAVPQLEPISSGVAVPSKRVFSEDDFALQFIAHEEFGGRREGFVFRLGAQGLGYYTDTHGRSVASKNDNDETSEVN